MSNYPKGSLFNDELLEKIRDKFAFVDVDPLDYKYRLYFDNAGGSLRLKSTVDKFSEFDFYPDHPQREHKVARHLAEVEKKGMDDVKTIFNASEGSIGTYLTASQAIFNITGTIAENTEGTNIVTTALEHPSAFDSAKYYADKLGRELRIAKTNPETGGVDPKEILKLIDSDTSLLSVIYASNISGAILDIEFIVKEARKIKPDLYIIVDSVQHAPHGLIDLEKTPVDAMNFAPYKFFGVRGIGVAYLSERAAHLPHHRLLDKDKNDLQLGSPIPEHFAAISEIVDYVCWIGEQFTDSDDRRELYVEGINRIALHERALLYTLLHGTENVDGLRSMPEVTVHFDHDNMVDRDLIVAISIDGIDHSDAVVHYEEHSIIVYDRVATNILSKRMLDSFNISGAIRITPLHCNNIEEIEQFLNVTKQIIKEHSN